MASENVIDIDESSFSTEVESSDLPVFVDVWGVGCGPCMQLEPIVAELAGEYKGKVKFAKMNVGENMGIAAKFGIRGVPTMLFFSGGEEKDRIVGMSSKDAIAAKLDALA